MDFLIRRIFAGEMEHSSRKKTRKWSAFSTRADHVLTGVVVNGEKVNANRPISELGETW